MTITPGTPGFIGGKVDDISKVDEKTQSMYRSGVGTLLYLTKNNRPSGKDEDWQMWSMKFCMCRMYNGYGTIMDGTSTVPTIDKLLKKKDDAVMKAGQMTIKLNKAGHVELMLSMSNIKSFLPGERT